ncbi:hypothetical protein GGQ84_000999 [Desulfitispora alkaliphila]|uniref:S-layer homology domain-containing protein n=1 Tax=Desulfitispora alkaliphila TaxID=622674 RepID=UPI003D1F0591
MRRLKRNKWLSVAILVAFCFSIFLPGVALAGSNSSTLIDVEKHWAEEEITNWVGRGLVTGYQDGTFLPNQHISRAEFVTIVNRVFGFTEESNVSFSDVSDGAWYAEQVKRAYAAGYITGYQDNTFRPNQEISRQEVATILARLFKLEGQYNLTDFNDYLQFPDWSKEAISSVVASGFMSGYPDNSFKPGEATTRAETVITLSRAAEEVFNKAGAYSNKTVAGNVVVGSADVVLENMTIEGNLYLTAGIGSGDVTIEGVNVTGVTYIEGGGQDSIYINNSSLNSVRVNKADGAVRVVAQGSTNIKSTVLESGAFLETSDGISGSGFEDVKIEAPANSVVRLAGSFANITVETSNVEIEVVRGSVQSIQVAEGATGVEVNVADGAIVVERPSQADPGEEGEDTGTSTPGRTGGSGSGGGTVSRVSPITITTTPTDVTSVVYDAEVMVMLSTSTDGAEIYYTTDGSTPASSSTLYQEPFAVTTPDADVGGTVTVKAIGMKSGMSNSAVAQKEIVFNPNPVATVANAEQLELALQDPTKTQINILSGTYEGSFVITIPGQEIAGAGKSQTIIDGNIDVEADEVTIKDLQATGTVTIAEQVDTFTAEGTDFDELTIDGGSSNSIRLRETTVRNVTVNKPEVRVAMRGASVSNVRLSSTAANARVEVSAGTQVSERITVEAPGVRLASRNAQSALESKVDVVGDQATVAYVDLHEVVFNVTDTETGAPIARVVIEIDGDRLATDSSGRVDVELEEDTYAYTVRAAGYNDVTDSVTVDKDMSLDLEMEMKTYTVIFENYDGTELKAQVVKHGQGASAPGSPSREGYRFIGWFPADFSNITRDLTVVAQYEEIVVVTPPDDVVGDFEPGEGGSLPSFPVFEAEDGKIGGLYAHMSHFSRRHGISGNPIDPQVRLRFTDPSNFDADNYTVQFSEDQGASWSDYIRNDEPLIVDYNYVWLNNVPGDYKYRLLVNGGPKEGYTSNVVEAPRSTTASAFTRWSLDWGMHISGVMEPYVGRGMEASFTARSFEDDEPEYINEHMTYQWYRVNPMTYEKAAISGATDRTYITTEADVGYYHLVRATGDDEHVGGFAQVLSLAETKVPNQAFVSNVSNDGFTLNLFKEVEGLTVDDLILEDYDYMEVPIDAVTPGANNAIYHISAQLDPESSPYRVMDINDFWTITAEYDDDYHMDWGGVPINFQIPVEEISIWSDMDTFTIGDESWLYPDIMPYNASDRDVTWSSSDDAVAIVNQDGRVAAIAPGVASITATLDADPEISASRTIVVAPIRGAGVTIEEGSAVFNYTFTDANGDSITYGEALAEPFKLDPNSSTVKIKRTVTEAVYATDDIQFSALEIQTDGSVEYADMDAVNQAFGVDFAEWGNVPTHIILDLQGQIEEEIWDLQFEIEFTRGDQDAFRSIFSGNEIDAAMVSAAINAIGEADYSDLQISDMTSQTEKTAAVQEAVYAISEEIGVDATVSFVVGDSYDVEVSRGEVSITTTIQAYFVVSHSRLSRGRFS